MQEEMEYFHICHICEASFIYASFNYLLLLLSIH